MKKLFLLPILLFISSLCFAQLERTLHQTVDFTSALKVRINLKGDYELVHWPGNYFLFETNVKLHGASKHLLDFFIGEGRYEVETETTGFNGLLKWKDQERKPLKYKGAECYEETKVKVFVPDFFNIIDAKNLINDRLQKKGISSDLPADWVRTVELENDSIPEIGEEEVPEVDN